MRYRVDPLRSCMDPPADSCGLSRGLVWTLTRALMRSLSPSRFWFNVQKVRRNLHTTRPNRRARLSGALDKSVRACVPDRVGDEAGGMRVVGKGRFRRWRISQSGAQPRVLIPSRRATGQHLSARRLLRAPLGTTSRACRWALHAALRGAACPGRRLCRRHADRCGSGGMPQRIRPAASHVPDKLTSF